MYRYVMMYVVSLFVTSFLFWGLSMVCPVGPTNRQCGTTCNTICLFARRAFLFCFCVDRCCVECNEHRFNRRRDFLKRIFFQCLVRYHPLFSLAGKPGSKVFRGTSFGFLEDLDDDVIAWMNATMKEQLPVTLLSKYGLA